MLIIPSGMPVAVGPIKLLLHCDGTDGSTTFPDSGDANHTVTAVGNAQVDTAQSKFGSASGLFDGSGDALTVPSHADWAFAGDFTVDFWLRAVNWGRTAIDIGNAQFKLTFYPNTADCFLAGSLLFNTGSDWDGTGQTWIHCAFVRSGSACAFYKNGVDIGSGTSSASTSAGLLSIGDNNSGSNSWGGHLDEFRISNGVAQWTSNFTPPAAPY